MKYTMSYELLNIYRIISSQSQLFLDWMGIPSQNKNKIIY